jgi:hypothetical protein
MKKIVHVVIENGCVAEVYTDADVEVVVHDLDCEDLEQKAHIVADVDKLEKEYNKVEIY